MIRLHQTNDAGASSRVVDGFGRPREVYHATCSEFTAFGVGDLGHHFGTLDAACERLQDLHNKTGCDRQRIARQRP